MKAILIDPYTNTVSTVEYNGDYRKIYDLIDCQTFEAPRINNDGDSVYVDEEGLLCLTPETRFFKMANLNQPLAGKGLVLGCNEEGESTTPVMSEAEVRGRVTFLSLAEVRASL